MLGINAPLGSQLITCISSADEQLWSLCIPVQWDNLCIMYIMYIMYNHAHPAPMPWEWARLQHRFTQREGLDKASRPGKSRLFLPLNKNISEPINFYCKQRFQQPSLGVFGGDNWRLPKRRGPSAAPLPLSLVLLGSQPQALPLPLIGGQQPEELVKVFWCEPIDSSWNASHSYTANSTTLSGFLISLRCLQTGPNCS